MYCTKCGQQFPVEAVFCFSCGAKAVSEVPLSAQTSSTHRADSFVAGHSYAAKPPRLFTAKSEWIFWVYIIGFVIDRTLSTAIGGENLVLVLNILELTAFIVAFSRSRFNWLTLWVYGLVGSNVLTWLGVASGTIIYIGELSVISALMWTVAVGFMVFGYIDLSRRLGLRAWLLERHEGAW